MAEPKSYELSYSLMYNFQSLTKKDWVTDYGFRKALEADPGLLPFLNSPGRKDVVAYWQREKSDYRLWELLTYMDSHTVPQTLAYFDLPADTRPFLKWVYNRVAPAERDRIPEMEPGLFGGGHDQMNYFPYPQLYEIWDREDEACRQARRGNVQVYLDRITEPDGRELVRLTAPTFYE